MKYYWKILPIHWSFNNNNTSHRPALNAVVVRSGHFLFLVASAFQRSATSHANKINESPRHVNVNDYHVFVVYSFIEHKRNGNIKAYDNVTNFTIWV